MNHSAIIFPGQGSQSVGMLKELHDEYQVVRDTFTEASDVLNYDLWQLVNNGPETELNETHRTQPALLTASTAIWRVFASLTDKRPAYLAGHSLGEYSALVNAGVLNFADAVQLVEQRGKFMQQAVPAGTGSMAAIIGLDDDAIKLACEEAAQGDVVSPVNYNSPGQVVIAGNKAAVERAGEACKDAGAKKVMPLSVSVPSHCALMKPAAEQLAEILSSISIKQSNLQVINNVDVSIESNEEQIKDALVRQLFMPVRWTEVVQFMANNGVTELYEFGPGKVLTGLTKRIDRSISAKAVNDIASINALIGE
ncbi:ACP S-malonyltransferase [Flocculibacter collagenilyticus]|uniref:ACP S-malonyltransferase n=1 Tax=Flocculibacter collagenilyticus TaxID=2744479 RepID=UPI0018F4D006|nr:ACP S-malonyltransferase [Flocculibacter collagenilyticus]